MRAFIKTNTGIQRMPKFSLTVRRINNREGLMPTVESVSRGLQRLDWRCGRTDYVFIGTKRAMRNAFIDFDAFPRSGTLFDVVTEPAPPEPAIIAPAVPGDIAQLALKWGARVKV